EDVIQEVNIVSRLAYKHIIQCYGVVTTANTVFIVTDYAEGGNLKDAISRLDWEDKKRIIVEVALGLDYLHSQEIVHGDIKTANILLTGHDEVKLCGFGSAMFLASATCTSSSVRVGTLRFMALESMRASPSYSFMSDVYALGVVMRELVHGD
ncbi:kinase-like domain-containing protein, partial [Dissophora ornata]